MRGSTHITPKPKTWRDFAVHVNSFRKIISTSLYSVRAHRLADSAIMDIGWNGDYIDEAAALTFAQGGDVGIEFFNQVTNLVSTRLPIQPPANYPRIIIGGVIQRQGTFMSSFWIQNDCLRTDLTGNRVDDANNYHVLNNDSEPGLVIVASCDSNKYDAWDAGSTNATPNENVGALSRFKNGVPFTPTTRGDYYNHVNPMGHFLLEQRNFSYTNFNSLGEGFVGSDWVYRNSSNNLLQSCKWRTEFIMMDNSTVYDPDEVRADIMNYYNFT